MAGSDPLADLRSVVRQFRDMADQIELAIARLTPPRTTLDPTAAPVFLRIAQVADRWKVGRETVRAMIERGELPATKFGASWRIDLNDVVEVERCRRFDSSSTAGNGPSRGASRLTQIGPTARNDESVVPFVPPTST